MKRNEFAAIVYVYYVPGNYIKVSLFRQMISVLKDSDRLTAQMTWELPVSKIISKWNVKLEVMCCTYVRLISFMWWNQQNDSGRMDRIKELFSNSLTASNIKLNYIIKQTITLLKFQMKICEKADEFIHLSFSNKTNISRHNSSKQIIISNYFTFGMFSFTRFDWINKLKSIIQLLHCSTSS